MVGDSKSNFSDASSTEEVRRPYARIARDLAWEASGTGRKIRLEVISHSMYPMLKPGDVVVVEKAQPESLRIGDLVVILRRGEFITHRLVGRDRDNCITKGDGLRHLDPPISKVAILGKVIIIERKESQINLQDNYWKLASVGLGYFHRWQGLSFRFLSGWKSRLKRKRLT